MCDVLQQLQPAGAFLRQAQNLQPAGAFLNPIALVGSCTDIDEALRFCDEEAADQMERGRQQENATANDAEPVDFLASIRRGLNELVAANEADDEDDDSDDDEDDESDDEGCYYQPKENTYYSPGQKLSGGFPLDDAGLDLSDTSTASSSLFTAWAQPESDEEGDDEALTQDLNQDDDLIFQLEM
ncbi:hypothetical protein PHYSODRAFT_286984 [Phytophthora sojae]|uniref:Uncharacterized protein n=1 Tax=Phytophthora sojae (strain P6497) TaxID=1094619 RepID=G4ZX21_PHYSP|nr:hypothetical protein PHYSODRAFT_286984 [Phytophthora sojae]EGZ12491.1 hypothetical protein PHYSODRAFT_286984 [Phytophthora sojae]|eukprot:XP_009532824.1 hypothetical protein PHYSODRAFT_286984 [Phytophthora sojae]